MGLKGGGLLKGLRGESEKPQRTTQESLPIASSGPTLIHIRSQAKVSKGIKSVKKRSSQQMSIQSPSHSSSRPCRSCAPSLHVSSHASRRRSLPRHLSGLVLWGITALAVLFASACAQQRVRNAPFRVRPDSVKPGNLLGPFDGQVLDAASGEPVAGAIVYASWTIHAGYGMTTPAGHRETLASTGADGRYLIKKLDDVPHGGSARVVDVVLVVYKRGYVAYRSDRRFEDLGVRHDFAQRQNRITLNRWRADYSHVRHLRYVGTGGPIVSLTQWERSEAAAEMSGSRGLAGPLLATDISVVTPHQTMAAELLSEKEVRAITGNDTVFESGPIRDDPDSDGYSSQHFRAVGQPETFDVAVRMWTANPDEAEQRFSELVKALPSSELRDEIADRSLRSKEADIIGISFLDRERGIVVLLTCGVAQCDDADSAVALARKVHTTLVELIPNPSSSKR